MPRAKKHPKLSADERAFLNRLDCLNEEEIKQLTTREIFAYFKIIDKVDPFLLMRARARATVRVWKKRPELQAHSRREVNSSAPRVWLYGENLPEGLWPFWPGPFRWSRGLGLP
jgi:hypothetical protein